MVPPERFCRILISLRAEETANVKCDPIRQRPLLRSRRRENPPLDLLLLHGLEDLDDALGVVGHVVALKHLAVLAAADLANNLVVVLVAAGRAAFPARTNSRTRRGRTETKLVKNEPVRAKNRAPRRS